jgi:hypothetical protein
MRCSGSAHGSAIAVHSAASLHAGNNDGVPTAAVSEVPRDEPIIATGSAITGSVAGESGCA